ncbi:MAG: penicillin-binding protein 1A [Gammaproteobacteria bacterium]|nr:penicillin-binding protein 1A [Gammaproteobacteria bacterium]
MKRLFKIIKWLLTLFILGLTIGTIALISIYLHLEPKLPSINNLRNVQLQVPLRVYTRDQLLIAEFGEKRRTPLIYTQIPQQAIHAFLAAEDNRFFHHPGVDYRGILRAALQLALTGKRRQGGSTITMQVARNFYLSSKKTFTRKINEILLSLRIEGQLTKEEILELYLNKIYLGNRSYGVGAAAEVYYGKHLHELNLAETAMIAGLPKAPSRFNPIVNPKRAHQRRDYVLRRMAKLDYITKQELAAALDMPVVAKLHRSQAKVEAPYIAEMVRANMVHRFGEQAYTTGYRVYTTIDKKSQTAAQDAIHQTLQDYDQRHGYRGAEQNYKITSEPDDPSLDQILDDTKTIGKLIPAVVTKLDEKTAHIYLGNGQYSKLEWEGLSWARPYISENRRGKTPKKSSDILKPGDLIRVIATTKDANTTWRLAQIPAIQGALISLDPNDGAILSLIGGYDYYLSKFNRVTQAKRQPGSGFKAIIYSAALEAGFTAASLINDAPIVINDPALETAWRPENYSGKFYGPTRLRMALTKSRNLVSIRLLRTMGMDHALKHAKLFGFEPKRLPHNLSLALGSGTVTPMQMAKSYAILANGGFRVEPYFIERIENSKHKIIHQAQQLQVCPTCPQTATLDKNGKAVYPAKAAAGIAPRVISPQNHYLMNSMMRDVVQRGTATKAKALGRKDIAGKTGTTNDQRDAWFNGFNRSLVAITWVGFDSSAPLGNKEIGGRAALPAWIAYMREALKNVEELPLEMPADMVAIRIDPKTGEPALPGQKNAMYEIFRAEMAPEVPMMGETESLGGNNLPPDATEEPKELF